MGGVQVLGEDISLGITQPFQECQDVIIVIPEDHL